jgi:membrane protease YdiL (CAAX protease family)
LLNLNLHKLSPAILTLLVFLLAQGVGVPLLLITGTTSVALFSLVLMGINILAVLACYFLLHNIRFTSAFDFSSIRWWPGMLAIASCIFGASSIAILTEKVELPQAMQEMSLAMSNDFCGLLAIVLIGPVTEELLFREAIAGEMLRRGASPWTAIIVSALAFGTIHLNLAQGIYAFPIGILLGIIYYKTGGIVLTSLFHILNNGINAALLHIVGEDIADISYKEWFGGAGIAYTFMVLFAALCILLIKLFWSHYQPCKETTKSSSP